MNNQSWATIRLNEVYDEIKKADGKKKALLMDETRILSSHIIKANQSKAYQVGIN